MMKITSSSGNPISPNIILFCGAMRTASISSSLFAGLKIFRLYFQDAFWMLFSRRKSFAALSEVAFPSLSRMLN